jgi:hypothetical protein
MTEDREMTRAEKIAWCKERAAAEPWTSAIGSMVQDMELMGIPMSEPVIQLAMMEGISGGERGVRRWIDGVQ